MRLLRCTNKRGAVATCTGEKSLFGQPYQNERSLATTTKRVTNFCDPTEERCQPASRTGLASASGLATASPARPLRACAPAHASTAHSARAQHACARLAGDAHALTQQHTLARPKLDVMLEHWPLAVCRLVAGASGTRTLRKCLAASAAREAHASSTRFACHSPPLLAPCAQR